MDKHSPDRIITRSFLALMRDKDRSSSTTQERALPAKDDRNQKSKRKACPEKKTQRKRARVSEVAEPRNSSEEDGRVTGRESKVREDREGPSLQTKQKTGGLLLNLYDKGSEHSSVDTGRENSSDPAEGCSTSVEDVCSGSGKRKTSADGEGPTKKKKRNLELKETKEDLTVVGQRAQFEAKYEEQNHLGKGGCGSVFAGYRKADNLPVAIKHIPQENVLYNHVDQNGKQLSAEVAIMLSLAAGTNRSVGTSASVALLDWYDLDQELILVLERPVPSEELYKYIQINKGCLQEGEVKTILKQLVDAAIELQDNCIFHRDIKSENILIETSSNVPRVRLIDFGLSCFDKKRSFYHIFYGTPSHVPPEWYSCGTYSAGPTTVWQLGVVGFEMLHRNTLFETTQYLVNDLEISSELSENCQNFLQMCLAQIPEQRPSLKNLQLHPWLK